MMCERCAELEERVAWLESELGLRVSADNLQSLRVACGFAPGVASLVLAMYAARGRTVTHLQILEAIPSPGANDDRVTSNVNTLICRARKALGRDAIANVWGRGYQMTPAGMDRVAAILSDQLVREAA